MEYEVRFYYNTKELNNLLNKLKEFNELKMGKRTYEKTIQYDHPNQEMSFYSKEIDGRYRIRVSKNEDYDKSKISWKRRLPKNETGINSEEEVEVAIKYEEINNLIFLTENVLKMKSIESYERYRTTFSNEEIEIALDEYPFGIALEIGAKSDSYNEVITTWLNNLNLKLEDSFKLSWDDKYTELCKEQGIEIHKHVQFDLLMPEVK